MHPSALSPEGTEHAASNQAEFWDVSRVARSAEIFFPKCLTRLSINFDIKVCQVQAHSIL